MTTSASIPANTALIVTSINPPNPVMTALRDGARENGVRFLVVGDTKSPSDFKLDGCDFLDIAAQQATGLKFAGLCPTRHYARKNVGYLVAIRDGAPMIIETDDDNYPRPAFFGPRVREQNVPIADAAEWLNLYRYFTDVNIWPRGLPLNEVQRPLAAFDALKVARVDCPIQQGLADANPDVDAVYRLILPLPQDFRSDRRVALGPGAWCPFNSQNTTWWPETFPLLYLPAYCSFRMTDIWRSFVAQRIAAANKWHILFHEPTVWQERNEHNLMKDFADEIPGYLNNSRIREILDALPVTPGTARIPDNLRQCYQALVNASIFPPDELPLLEAWLTDLAAVTA